METDRKGLLTRKWIFAILLYIGLIALCCIVVYAIPSVRGMLEKTYIAQYGSIDVTDEVSAFIVRDETVYTAGQKSMINRIAETDKLVKAYTQVVDLIPTEKDLEKIDGSESDNPIIKGAWDALPKEEEEQESAEGEDAEGGDAEGESAEGEDSGETEDQGWTGRYSRIMDDLDGNVAVTEDGVAKDSGYICYFVDGAEAKLSTDALDSLTEKDLKELTGRKSVNTPDNHCGKGYPIFKVVHNSKWYLVYYLDNESAAKYYEGDTVNIDINGEQVAVRVSRVESGTKTTKIALSCKTFFPGFSEMRTLDTTVTINKAEGLMLDDSSIVTAPDGMRGVFVKNKLGEHVFKPISAKADNGKKCVAYSDIYVDADGNFVETIRTYDEIVSEPTEEDMAGLEKSHPAKKQ